MKWRTGGVMIAALLAATTAELSAQRGSRGPGARGAAGGTAGVERVLRLREQLELTEAQIAELDAIRREGIEERASVQAENAELASRLRAGQIERSEVREAMAGRREGRADEVTARRERVEAVLSEEQLASLQELGARRRAFAAGRASVRRGRQGMGRRGSAGRSLGRPGVRGQRGRAPGMRRGIAPGVRRFDGSRRQRLGMRPWRRN